MNAQKGKSLAGIFERQEPVLPKQQQEEAPLTPTPPVQEVVVPLELSEPTDTPSIEQALYSIHKPLTKKQTHRMASFLIPIETIKRLDAVVKGKPRGFKGLMIEAMFQYFVEYLESPPGKTMLKELEKRSRG